MQVTVMMGSFPQRHFSMVTRRLPPNSRCLIEVVPVDGHSTGHEPYELEMVSIFAELFFLDKLRVCPVCLSTCFGCVSWKPFRKMQ